MEAPTPHRSFVVLADGDDTKVTYAICDVRLPPGQDLVAKIEPTADKEKDKLSAHLLASHLNAPVPYVQPEGYWLGVSDAGRTFKILNGAQEVLAKVMGLSEAVQILQVLNGRPVTDYIAALNIPATLSEPTDRDVLKAMLDRAEVRYDESRITPTGAVSQIAVMALNEYKPVEQQVAFTFDETTGALKSAHFRTLHRNTDHA